VFWYCLHTLSATFLNLKRAERNIVTGVRRSSVMYPFFLSDFNKTWIFSTIFRKILKYQIQRNSVQREPNCSLRTNRQEEMAKLIIVFLKSTNGPKYDYFLIHSYVVGLYNGPGLFSLSKERTVVFCVYNLDGRQSPRQCHCSRCQSSASHWGCLAILAQFMWNL
jgi:hypothetical protein